MVLVTSEDSKSNRAGWRQWSQAPGQQEETKEQFLGENELHVYQLAGLVRETRLGRRYHIEYPCTEVLRIEGGCTRGRLERTGDVWEGEL